MVTNFTLKEITEVFHNIESTNDKMVEANLNLKDSDNLQWYRKDAYPVP